MHSGGNRRWVPLALSLLWLLLVVVVVVVVVLGTMLAVYKSEWADTDNCCCYRRLSWWVNRKCTSRRTFFPFGNEPKMSYDTQMSATLIPQWERKKCLLCFETPVFHSREVSTTRRWAIDSDDVARLGEISSVVKVVLLAMCLSVFAFGLVGCNSRWDLSLFLIMILCYLAPVTRYISQFTFQVFFPKAVFGFTL